MTPKEVSVAMHTLQPTRAEWSSTAIFDQQLQVGVILKSLKPPDNPEHAAVWFGVRNLRARCGGAVPLWRLLDAVEVWRLPRLQDVPTRAVKNVCAELAPELISAALNAPEASGVGAVDLP
jgi:hypothetical protein